MAKLNKYPKYKPSKIQWLGDIPEHWNVKRIKYLIRKKISDGPHETPEFIEAGIPFLSVDGIQDGELIFEGCRFISETEHKRFQKKTIVEKGDILLGKAASIGKIARVKVDFDFNVWSPLAIIKPNEKINNTFFEHYLKSTLSQYQIEILCTSNTQKNISMDDIPEILVVLPPKEEQTAIANYLDQKTSQLATLIANKQKLIELLKEERIAIINEAVSGKGKNWEKKKLKYITSKIGDGIHATPEYTDFTDFLFINGTNLNDGKIEAKELTRTVNEEEYLKLKLELKLGTILLSLNGTIGKIAFYQGEKIVLGKSVAYIECENEINNLYAYFVLQSNYVQEYFETSLSGTTIRNLSLYTLRNTSIYLPKIKEQIQIVKNIETETNRIDNTISKIEKEIELMKEYRTALISEVVTGKVKVC